MDVTCDEEMDMAGTPEVVRMGNVEGSAGRATDAVVVDDSKSSTMPSVQEDPNRNEDTTTGGSSLAKFRVLQKVYARDKDGVLYMAVIRRQLYGPQYHRQVEMGLVSSQEEADQIIEKSNDNNALMWHYFVHFNKWNVKFDRWVSEYDIFDITDETTAYATRISTEHRELHLKMRKHKTNKKASQTVDGAAFFREWRTRLISIDKDFATLLGTPSTAAVAATTSSLTGSATADKANTAASATSPTKATLASSYWTQKRLLAEHNLREQGLTEKRPSHVSNAIILPFALKKVIVQQWEIIIQCQMLPCLPVPTTIRQVLDMYLESKNVVRVAQASNLKSLDTVAPPPVETSRDAGTPASVASTTIATNTNIDSNETKVPLEKPTPVATAETAESREHEWNTMADGIAMLFDELLPSQLLYDEELVQRHVMLNLPEFASKPDSEIYGCEHLVRLFVKLPELLDTMADDDVVDDSKASIPTKPRIIAKVNDFIRFLDKNHGTVFCQSHRKLNELERKEQLKRLRKQEEKKRSIAPAASLPTAHPSTGTTTGTDDPTTVSEVESVKKKARTSIQSVSSS